MADTVQITAGAGTVIGTDEVTIGATLQHVQRVKLVDGTDGGTDLLPGSAARGLTVDPRPKLVRVQVTPAVSTTPAYAVKDAIGGLLTFANLARASGGSVFLESVQIVDKGQQMTALDLLLFDRSITAPTDNAIFNPSDTELGYLVEAVSILGSDWRDQSTNSAVSRPVDRAILLNGSDLYGVLVSRGTPTFTSTTDVVVTVNAYQD